MYARVTSTQISPESADEAIQLWQESVMPEVQQQKGFKGAYLLANRKVGTGVTITLWETEADAQASGEGSPIFQQSMAQFARYMTAAPVIEQFEVAAAV